MKQQREELARELVRKDSQMKEMQQRLESGDGCEYCRSSSAGCFVEQMDVVLGLLDCGVRFESFRLDPRCPALLSTRQIDRHTSGSMIFPQKTAVDGIG